MVWYSSIQHPGLHTIGQLRDQLHSQSVGWFNNQV